MQYTCDLAGKVRIHQTYVRSHVYKHIIKQTYLGIEAAATGTELEEEFTFWMLLVDGASVESWARGTFPMRYQIPMLLSSL